MISTDDVQRAVDFLRDNAEPAAKARAERMYMEAWVKTVLAQEMAKRGSQALGAQERDARCSPGYLASLQAMKESVQEDERQRYLRAAAEAKIQAWQTMSANERAVRV